MGFFSDPAARQVKDLVIAAPAPVQKEAPSPRAKPSSSRRKRASDSGRRRRKSTEVEKSGSTIPTSKEAELLDKRESQRSARPLSSSVLGNSSARRRSSASTNTTASTSIGSSWAEWGNMNTSFRNNGAVAAVDPMNMSMQDHMEEIEKFVSHVKASDPKRRSSIFAMATQEIEEECY